MQNQCLGLAERLDMPVRTFAVRLKAPWRWLAPHKRGLALRHLAESSDRLQPPWPRVLIACGRQSIPVSMAVKRVSPGTLTVQCQNPRIDARNFNLVVPPEHDRISGAHIFPIVGSPNRVSPARLAQARREFAGRFSSMPTPRVAVLIGGSSKTHGRLGPSEARALGRALHDIAKTASLMVTTSRRTDPQVKAILLHALADTGAYVWDGAEPNPYLGLLAFADAIVVTADSVNMACEAGATGKPVHVFRLPRATAKSRRFHESLMKRGVTRPFAGHIEAWSYPPLDETGRAAERIKALLDASTAAAIGQIRS